MVSTSVTKTWGGAVSTTRNLMISTFLLTRWRRRGSFVSDVDTNALYRPCNEIRGGREAP